ncbi:DNA mismatch repair endonuclease MutL [Ruminococcus sp.]|jgi:DNA mismatch repair protein MutL|uniref:DNA mismatch repair endonuclease MutL n=1 Tax=Ruminococcus sp. TaxID=41978 RepID=UPI0015A0C576|nr:DNA mismatch repair endonuclease MutL [Ruminococcus sp.]
MGVINVLDKHVAELIAAGEVVERPASVIKELVENSIDAGAKHITVEIKNGGTTFMRVADDGCGIFRDDIKVAFLRHATSKVKVESDLDSISTLGFRGEALASICAVSRLQLITRNVNEEIGTSYEIDGGEEQSFDDAGCPVGTTFVIRDLFYNIPARAKFLKKDVSEGNAVSNIIDKTALSHPEIAFTYIKDGKQVLRTFGDGKLISAIYSVFGKDFAKGLIPVEYQLDAIKVYGYISKPEHSRPNRNMQNFFINGRYIKTRTAMVALEEAFKGSIMVGKFPSCVLNINLPCEIIDVNVHPSKLEVRFINERPVFDAIYHAVKSSLMKYDSRKKASFKKETAFNEVQNKFNPFNNAPAILNKPVSNASEQKLIQEPNRFVPQKTEKQKNEAAEPDALQAKSDDFNPFSDVAFNDVKTGENKPAVSVPESIDDIKVADVTNPFNIFSRQAINNSKEEKSFKPTVKSETVQTSPHALDKYEKSDNTEKISEKNSISKPKEVDVIVSEESIEKSKEPVLVNNSRTSIRYIGEAFSTYIIAEKNNKEIILIDKHAAHERIIYEKLKSERTADNRQILLSPVAVSLGKTEYDAAINNLNMFADCGFEVEDFGNSTVIVRCSPQYIPAAEISDCITEMADYIAQGKNDIFTEKMEWFYCNVACRSAIKAGNKSTPEELIGIVKHLEEHPEIKYCPHGRPICIVLTKGEIEKQFGRV